MENCVGISKPRSKCSAHIEIIHGHAAFTSDTKPTIEVSGRKYTAPHILIATGGMPSSPHESQIPGASLGITSDGFFELEELPRGILLSLVIRGDAWEQVEGPNTVAQGLAFIHLLSGTYCGVDIAQLCSSLKGCANNPV
ncbi:hypothetical protein P7K49_027430 [Saguinus oedipus]|uniref:Uncharacterized protein n=1 Tax=Saguinus oedipus TaxID=9490 RepID=A0ABQ9U9E5_SAGOE|nr:hypothetical protein P7K49_027430 [Saguinus oedipus]